MTERVALRTIALMAVLGVALEMTVVGAVTTTSVVAILLAPVWIPVLPRYRYAVGLLVMAGAAVFFGWLMTLAAPWDLFIDEAQARGVAILVLSGFGGLGVLLWARTIVPLDWLVLAFGIGFLIQVLPDIPESENFWKYQLSMPITLIVLAVVGRYGGLMWSVGALSALGIFGILNDSRSYFGMCALAIVILIWHTHERGPASFLSRSRNLGLLVVGFFGLYTLATSFLVSGYLGSVVQERSLQQLQSGGGALLLGGRPEWAATSALFQARPSGFGLGAVPRLEDILVAKSGLERVGLSSRSGYVDAYMFGDSFELHSIIADFWAWFGLVGLALGVWMFWLVLRNLLRPIADTAAAPAAVFMGVAALWFLLFGPVFSNLPDVMLALAMLLPLAGKRDDGGRNLVRNPPASEAIQRVVSTTEASGRLPVTRAQATEPEEPDDAAGDPRDPVPAQAPAVIADHPED